MSEQYLHPVDIKDSHVLTRVLNEKLPESKVYDVPFCPLYPFNGRKVRLAIKMHEGAGLAPFKADNGSTPVVPASGQIQEVYIELALIAEKEVLDASTLIDLESPDDRIGKMAAETVLEKAMRLQQRNVNRTRWMAWQAIKDSLTISYDGVTIAVDYDLDGDGLNSNRFSASHLPTYSSGLSGTAWSSTSADIIEDAYTCAKLIADDLGIDETEVMMMVNSTTWRYMKKNTGVAAELSSTNPRIITPKLDETAEILGIAGIQLRNDFYFTAAGVKTKFLPDGYALFMPQGFEYNGTPIIEMYDGLVARVVGGDIVVSRNPGLVAEIYISEEQAAKNVRVQTARMPVVNHPAGIVYAQVY
jgi:hypothetical protein